MNYNHYYPIRPTPRQSSSHSALLILSAVLTGSVSLCGAFMLSVMSYKSGFEEGDSRFGILMLTLATPTLLFGLGGSLLALLLGSQLGRILVTACCAFYLVNGTVTLLQGNIGSIVQLLVAVPLSTLWWLPATSKAMRAKQAPTGPQGSARCTDFHKIP
ncbi:hypothetical protein [Saccharopolyspora sp. NPDC049426]|uniref:hypothetical protein n=1 Tax=Saccharopolyspora sp. NPDC049426 TaxID=3155652 RepID=UPI00342C1DA5